MVIEMTVRTKGDLCGLTIRTEQTYGEIDASGTSMYGGTLRSMSTSGNSAEVEEIHGCTRLKLGDFVTGRAFGYTAVFNFVRSQGWTKWIELATGSLEGIQRQSDSYDTAFRVSKDENRLMTGCRVNSLSISASDIGQALEFSVNAMCRWYSLSPFEDSDGTSLSMDLASIPAGAPITYLKKWEYSTDGSQFTPIPGKSWTLTINQNLQGEPDVNDPDDEDGYKLEAGGDSVPQASEVTLEITITSTGPEWDQLRHDLASGLTFRVEIDGYLVTLTGCRIEQGDPDRTADSGYDETISVTATDIVVTEAA